jgi:ATP-dependent DNA ligase
MEVKMNVTDPNYIFPPKPLYVPPSSPTLVELDNDPLWIAEVKKNGWRCMVRVKDSKIVLWTRHKTIIKDPLPNLRLQLEALKLPDDTILDGELMEHRGKTKEFLMLWGLMRWSGEWIDKVPYQEIMEKMKAIVPVDTQYMGRPASTLLNKKAFYEQTILSGPENEGIVIKKLSASVPFDWSRSKEIATWLKVKPYVYES